MGEPITCPAERCPKTFVQLKSLQNHILKVHPELREKVINQPTFVFDVAESARRLDAQDHRAVRNIFAALGKALPDRPKNGADELRRIAAQLKQPPSIVSDAAREALAEELITIAAALDYLYRELQESNLRTLQTKARRWDTVAQAVVDAISEEVK